MKYIYYILVSSLIICSCKNKTKISSTIVEDLKKEDITTSIYPESVTKVFDAHGGIDNWNKMQMLSFAIEKPNGDEVITTNLKTRSELIDTPIYTLGYDGNELWINEKNGNEYKGNARFYKGLMMYFYAMPFIVSDSGIIYEVAEPLLFEGETYPGISISFESGVGESPNDQYVIYYNAKTNQMEWLAYTVTFGQKTKSRDFHFIRYNNWQTVNGLVVPKRMDWYTYENNLPIEKRNTVIFKNIVLSRDEPDPTMFNRLNGASVIE